MTYIFLIIVINSSSTSMQIQPMESMEQCHAAIKAIDIAEQKSAWNELIPRINNIKCIEVKQ